jgi:hypothetical protein
MHTHEHCFHELKYCSICDCVYCQKCGKEWKNNVWNTLSPSNWTFGNGTAYNAQQTITIPQVQCSNHTTGTSKAEVVN